MRLSGGLLLDPTWSFVETTPRVSDPLCVTHISKALTQETRVMSEMNDGHLQGLWRRQKACRHSS